MTTITTPCQTCLGTGCSHEIIHGPDENDRERIKCEICDGFGSVMLQPYAALRAETQELSNIVGKMIVEACDKYGTRRWYYLNVARPAIQNYYDAVFDGIKQKHGLPATEWILS